MAANKHKPDTDGFRVLPPEDVPHKEVPDYLLEQTPDPNAESPPVDTPAQTEDQKAAAKILNDLLSGFGSVLGTIFFIGGIIAAYFFFGPIGAIIFLLFEIATSTWNKKK